MKGFWEKIALSIAIMFVCFSAVFGTHLRSGEITIERECNSKTVKIHLKVYINTASAANSQLGGNSLNAGHINFGDGSVQLIPHTQNTPRPDLGVNIGIAEFSTTHTYASTGIYKIAYFEKDRSAGVLNIPLAEDVPYVAASTINIDDAIGCNNYPTLTIAPLDHACIGRTFTHNAGVVDPEGDSLSYEMSVPAGKDFAPVPGYLPPNNAKFYTDFAHGNEAGTAPPTFSIDAITGVITWDAPGVQGEFNIAFVVKEWRKNPVTDEFVLLSSIVRDMQIIVEDCINKRPDIILPVNVCVMAGTHIKKTITGTDPDFDMVKIEPFSEIFTLPMPATYAPFPPSFGSSNPKAEQLFEWRTKCVHVRDQPYQIIYKISDAPAHETSLVTFKSWSIKVMAPPPTLISVDLDLVKRYGMLKWSNSACANADRIQIWRKVGGYNVVTGACSTGLPAYLGYDLVEEVDPASTSYIDTGNGKGLAPGAFYCYRIVAAYNNPIAKSVVSNEKCIGPIETDAPVITHVSVKKTGVSDGAMRVSWRSPFKINKTQFPGPYSYEVYRGDGFESELSTLVKASVLITDTTFVDTGIDTDGSPYHYAVVVYSRTQFDPTIIPIDTSSVASSVRLDVVAREKKLELHWQATVPWSNTATENPRHLIYRGTDENNMGLIDSVDVTVNGFTYVDVGQFNNVAIDPNQKYCYSVVTRGTYGNPKIKLQQNYSQSVCIYPDSELPPCKPTLTIEIHDCEKFLSEATCGPGQFLNTIYWTPIEEQGCRSDIRSYNVYYAKNDVNGTYELLATHVRDTFFIETNLTSLARCYKVTAIDSKGQESEMSDAVCNDNCPYYELPNVFTPNGDGCNDLFSAYHDSGSNQNCPIVNVSRCPRFVDAVRIKIMNRWGKEVYTFNSQDGAKSVYIEWDGRDNGGSQLDAGNYYYVADIAFDAVDPKKKTARIKGWVQLIR